MTSSGRCSWLGIRGRRALAAAVVLAVSTIALLPTRAQAAPSTPPRAQFSSVSCPSSTFCLAVGSRDNTSGVPVPWTGASGFGAVSCVDKAFCVALTSVHGANRVARWNGTSWSLVTLGGTAPKDLFDVQCRTRTFCMLVGTVTNRTVAAAWHYNGDAWYPQTLPHPGAHILASVSCPTTTVCFAAGDEHVGYKSYAYVVRWGGKGWHASYLPRHNGAFADIACLSTTRCTAVGDGTSTADSHASGLVVDLANGSWKYSFVTRKLLPNRSEVQGERLACSKVACTAVLSYEPGGSVNVAYLIAVRGTSGGFALGSQRFPDLSGLSCTGTSCIVVGSTLADLRNSDTLPPMPSSATAYRRHGTTLARFAVPQR